MIFGFIEEYKTQKRYSIKKETVKNHVSWQFDIDLTEREEKVSLQKFGILDRMLISLASSHYMVYTLNSYFKQPKNLWWEGYI